MVQASTKRVVGGNGRLAVMRQLGWTECDVVELELDDTQATALDKHRFAIASAPTI